MATAQITQFEIDDYGTKRSVYKIQFQTERGWKEDHDHMFASLDEAKAWLAANGHKLATEA